MSCTDPILSIEALIQRAVRYRLGCGSLMVAQVDEEDPFTCAEADIPDLVLLAMAFDSGANMFRVNVTTVSIATLCADFDLRIECVGVTSSQALHETFTVGDGVATIRVLYIDDALGGCLPCEDTMIDTGQMVGSTVVTDGVDSYILVIAPAEGGDPLTCDNAEIGAEAFARAALSEVGDCGMWAWKIQEGDLDDGGGFDAQGFSNGFDI